MILMEQELKDRAEQQGIGAEINRAIAEAKGEFKAQHTGEQRFKDRPLMLTYELMEYALNCGVERYEYLTQPQRYLRAVGE